MDLSTGVQTNDPNRLKKHIHWRNDNKSVGLAVDIPKAQSDESTRSIIQQLLAKRLGRILDGKFVLSYTVLANAVNIKDKWFRQQRPGDLLEPAKLAICKIVNGKLKGRFSPRVLLENDGSIGRYLTPDSLLAAMCLQTRDLVTGRKRLVECERCGRRLDTTKGRMTKRLCKRCSQYLRTKRWREKTREKKQYVKKTGKE